MLKSQLAQWPGGAHLNFPFYQFFGFRGKFYAHTGTPIISYKYIKQLTSNLYASYIVNNYHLSTAIEYKVYVIF